MGSGLLSLRPQTKNMPHKEQTQKLLEKYALKPNKVLGQNFLIHEETAEILVKTAQINKKDVVVEVGPGTGAITKKLAKKAKRVIAVEKDPEMVEILIEELMGFGNIKVILEDILKFKITNDQLPITNKTQGSKKSTTHFLQPTSYKLVGAPPYYLTSRLFRKFLEEAENKPELIALIIQKEVAQKIIATPPKSNLLSISIQLYGEPKIIKIIPKSSFWPTPKVDSAILVVKNIKNPFPLKSGLSKGKTKTFLEHDFEKLFFKILKAGFSSPRKQILGNLSKKLELSRAQTLTWLKKSNIKPEQRAQNLNIEDWKKLVKNFYIHK